MLVLGRAALAEGIGMESGIALVVVAVQEHEGPLAAEPIAEGMDGSQGSVAVYSSLAGEGPAVVGEGVVQTGVEEGGAGEGVTAVEGARSRSGGSGGVWNKGAVEVGVEDIDAEGGQAAKSRSPPGQPSPQVGEVGIVLLGKLGLRTVIAVGDDGTGRAVIIEGGIQGAVGGKGRQPPVVCQPPRRGSTPQIAVRRPGGMGRQHMIAASLRLKHGQLAQMEAGIHDQPHAHLNTEHTEVQLFEPAHAAQLEKIGIVVVAPAVVTGEEGFTGILGCRQAELEAVAVVELIAQVVAIAIAGIAVPVALALIERNLEGGLQGVTAFMEEGGE